MRMISYYSVMKTTDLKFHMKDLGATTHIHGMRIERILVKF